MSQVVLDPVLWRGNRSLQVGGAHLELATLPTGSQEARGGRGGTAEWRGAGDIPWWLRAGGVLEAHCPDENRGPRSHSLSGSLSGSLAWPSAGTPLFHS